MANRIFIHLKFPSSPRQQHGKSGLLFVLLVTSLGLSAYLAITHTWFLFLVPTALTLFFIAGFVLIFSIAGWRGIWSPPKLEAAESRRFITVVLIFFTGLFIYIESPFLNLHDVFERLPKLQAYNADPVCSSSVMYKLAKTKPVPAAAAAPSDLLSTGVCEVKWVQVTVNGQPIADHPFTRLWAYPSIRGVRKGDFVVAQTAFGRLSAVLYPSVALEDWLFCPRGILVPTGDNPVPKFEEAFMWNFWILLILIFTGGAILWRLPSALVSNG